jgi:hypothetical protein
MTSLVTLMKVAGVFWTAAAPGVADAQCPAGVRTAVVPQTQMQNSVVKGVQAEAALGSCVITFRAGWRRDLTDRQACGVVLHEYGHAALSLEHSPGGIMSSYMPQRLPGACGAFTNRNRDQ